MKSGIIDIGSNSVRMAWIDDMAHPTILPQERLRYSRFAENATANGYLSDEAVARTIDAIRALMAEAKENGVVIRRISATSALREAINRKEVLARMEATLGQSITVLKGEEEARYSYEGAVYGLPEDIGVLMVLDVGGGSTELCWGRDGAMSASVPVGAVRLKESAAQIGSLEKAMAPLYEQAPKGKAVTLVGVGGTLTTMAAIFEKMTTYNPQSIHQRVYALTAIETLNKRLKDMPVSARLTLPGVTAGRADILTQGLDIAIFVMRALSVDTLTVSTTDLLFGQLKDLLNA